MDENRNNIDVEEPGMEMPAANSEQTLYEKFAPVEEQTKSRKIKLPFIIGGAVVVLAAAAALVISLLTSSPLALVATGAQNTAEAIAKSPYVGFMEKVSDGGSVEIGVDLAEMDLGISLDAGISAKIYSKSSESAMAVSLNAELMGRPILDALLVANETDLALSSDILFGDSAYGIKLQDASDNFEGSIFGYDGAYSLGIESIDEYLPDMQQSEDTGEELLGHVTSVFGEVVKKLQEYADISKSGEALSFSSGEVKTTAVRLAMDDEAITAFVRDMNDYIRNDQELKNFLLENTDYLSAILGMESYYYGDPEMLTGEIEAMYESMDSLAADYEELAAELEGYAVELVFHISKSGKYLVGVNCNVEAEGEAVKVELLAGPSPDKLSELRAKLDTADSKSDISYIVNANDESSYSALLHVGENGQAVFGGSISWDKMGGDLRLEYTDALEYIYGMSGSMIKSDETVSIVVDTITIAGDSTDLGIDVVLNTFDEMPAVPEYTDVLTMSENDFEILLEDIQSIYENLIFGMYGMAGMF